MSSTVASAREKTQVKDTMVGERLDIFNEMRGRRERSRECHLSENLKEKAHGC